MRLLLSRHRGRSKGKVPWLDARTIARLTAVAGTLSPAGAEIGLVVVDDDFIRDLNRTYRGIDRATDVISFSYADDADPRPAGEDVAGEVYVSFETVEVRARSEGVPPEHLFLRVGVHGLLHVIGHDHEARPEAEKMEREERRLLAQHLTPPEVEELF